jgi:hypothetical protein
LDGLRLKAVVDMDEHAMIQSELSTWYEGHSVKAQARFLDQFAMHPAVQGNAFYQPSNYLPYTSQKDEQRGFGSHREI